MYKFELLIVFANISRIVLTTLGHINNRITRIYTYIVSLSKDIDETWKAAELHVHNSAFTKFLEKTIYLVVMPEL